jgi:hypothetical protein
MNRALGAAVVLILLLLGPACGKDDENPVKPGPPPGPTYPVLSTPGAVLDKLRMSYEYRDSLAYDSCFEADYLGASYDTSEAGPPQPGTFTFADEAAHIRALARDPDITSVDLFLPTPWARITVPGDTLGDWSMISVHNPQGGVTDGANTVQIAVNETFEFSFRPATPAPTSPTDTLWRIVRWVEMP